MQLPGAKVGKYVHPKFKSYAHGLKYTLNIIIIFFFFFFFFSTGLVRLYIAGLPLRSCRTIGAPSVQGSVQCAFFPFR